MKISNTQWFQMVTALAPLVLMNVKGGATISTMIPVIVGGIQEAEQIAGATGPEKKAHVMKVLEAGVAAANASGKVHLDPVRVAQIASSGIDTVIAVINVMGGAHVVKAA